MKRLIDRAVCGRREKSQTNLPKYNGLIVFAHILNDALTISRSDSRSGREHMPHSIMSLHWQIVGETRFGDLDAR
jgi:hypothetical protein